MANTQTITISVPTTGGFAGYTTGAIKIFRLDHFAMTIGTVTAGSAFYITVTAQDSTNATVTPYNGTVSFDSANGGVDGAATGTLSTVTFASGVAYPRIQLYYAATNRTLRVASMNPNPGTVTGLTSAGFTVNPATATQLLVLAPNQVRRSGATSGAGKTGTIISQTAGSAFTATVYVTDPYFNTVTGTPTWVTLTPTDLGFGGSVTPAAQNTVSGVASFTCNLRRVLTGSQVLSGTSAYFGGISDNVTVPLVPTAVSGFGFNNQANKTAGTNFSLVVTAYDPYGNTCSSVGGTVTLGVTDGAISYANSSMNPYQIAAGSFVSGVYTNNSARLYRKWANVHYTATLGGATGVSNSFQVLEGAANQLIVIFPGRNYLPGEQPAGPGNPWGYSGNPTPEVANIAFSATVYVADFYGNQVVEAPQRTVTLTPAQTDAGMTPTSVQTISGKSIFSLRMTRAYINSQDITASSSGLNDGDSGTFTVSNSTIDHFSITFTPATSVINAGQSLTITVAAVDQFGNVVTNWTPTGLWLTVPTYDYMSPVSNVESTMGIRSGSAWLNYTATVPQWYLNPVVGAGYWQNGQISFQGSFYRATTTTPAAMFITNTSGATPSSPGTLYGWSSNVTVRANGDTTHFGLYLQVPGVQFRPGGVGSMTNSWAGDGVYSTPSGESVGSPFSVTIYAVDGYYNPLTGTPAPSDTLTFQCNQPGTDWSANPSNPSLINGYRLVELTCTVAENFIFIVTDGSRSYTINAPIVAYAVVAMNIESNWGQDNAPGVVGSIYSRRVAGLPFYVTITAYSSVDPYTIATTFTGDVSVHCSGDVDDSKYTLLANPAVDSKQLITFADGGQPSGGHGNGTWTGWITIHKVIPMNTQITLSFGGVNDPKIPIRDINNFPMLPNPVTGQWKYLIIFDGMDTTLDYRGLAPGVINPDYGLNLSKKPNTQKAGIPVSKLKFQLCDQYWNKVTTAPGHSVTITTNQPPLYPTRYGQLNNPAAVALPYTVTMNNGELLWDVAGNTYTGLVFYRSGSQTLTISSATYPTACTLDDTRYGSIPVQHGNVEAWNFLSSYQGFQISGLPATIIAGDNLGTAGGSSLQIVAVDPWSNTLDSMFNATPFGSQSVKQVVSVGVKQGTVWPQNFGDLDNQNQFIDGICAPTQLYLYKSSTNQEIYLQKTYNNTTLDTSLTDHGLVQASTFKRLVAVLTNMTRPTQSNSGGGYYTFALNAQEPPASNTPNGWGIWGNPTYTYTAGQPLSSEMGGSGTFLTYSCDIYGNRVTSITDTVSLHTSDRFAPLPTNSAIDGVNGWADFGIGSKSPGDRFAFHTRGSSHWMVAQDETDPAIFPGIVQNIAVQSAAFIGWQLRADGSTVLEGSGNSGYGVGQIPFNVSQSGSTIWYTGVTPTSPWTEPDTDCRRSGLKLGDTPFNMYIRAVDYFGNLVSSVNQQVTLFNPDEDQNDADPTAASPRTVQITSGASSVQSCHFGVQSTGGRSLNVHDTTNVWALQDDKSVVKMQVQNNSNTEFRIRINDVQSGGPVPVRAHPYTFKVEVVVVVGAASQTVPANAQFKLICRPSAGSGEFAGGHLAWNNGVTAGGVYTNTNSYTQAGDLYIQVMALNDAPNAPSLRPLVYTSARVLVSPSDPGSIRLTSDAGSYDESGVTKYRLAANHSARINAVVYDESNRDYPAATPNPIPGQLVSLSIVTPGSTSHLLPPQNLTTDLSGIAYSTFYASAQNIENDILGTAGTKSAHLFMNISVTDNGGVYPNPFDPGKGQSANIDFTLDKNSDVKVSIYTLLGDLVWQKTFPSGTTGGRNGINSITWDGKNNAGTVIANGGYICDIKANDQPLKRFKIGVFKEK